MVRRSDQFLAVRHEELAASSRNLAAPSSSCTASTSSAPLPTLQLHAAARKWRSTPARSSAPAAGLCKIKDVVDAPNAYETRRFRPR